MGKTFISENIKANLKTDRINRKNNDEVMNTTQRVNWVCIYQCKNKKDTPSQKRMPLKPIKGNAHYILMTMDHQDRTQYQNQKLSRIKKIIIRHSW